MGWIVFKIHTWFIYLIHILWFNEIGIFKKDQSWAPYQVENVFQNISRLLQKISILKRFCFLWESLFRCSTVHYGQNWTILSRIMISLSILFWIIWKNVLGGATTQKYRNLTHDMDTPTGVPGVSKKLEGPKDQYPNVFFR